MVNSATMKRAAHAIIVVTVGLWGSAAAAQDFGSQGRMVFGLERAMGLYFTSRTLEDERYDHATDTTSFSLLTATYPLPSPYALPRAGFDYFFLNHWSLGGSLGFSTSNAARSRYDTRDRVTDRRGERDQSLFIIAPRFGYALKLSEVIAIWPRGGFTVYMQSERDDRRIRESALALTLEFQLVITPLPHFGITVGPVLDFGVAGSRDRDNPNDPEYNLRQHSLGIAVGLFGWL
jgi:hypothetical protein